jgi:hypothetical protein
MFGKRSDISNDPCASTRIGACNNENCDRGARHSSITRDCKPLTRALQRIGIQKNVCNNCCAICASAEHTSEVNTLAAEEGLELGARMGGSRHERRVHRGRDRAILVTEFSQHCL